VTRATTDAEQAALDAFTNTDTNTNQDGEDDDWSEGDKILYRNAVTTVREVIDDDRVAVESPTAGGGRLEADRELLAEPHDPAQ